jgi:hypothetical protein
MGFHGSVSYRPVGQTPVVSISGISITFSFSELILDVSVGYLTNGLEEGWNHGEKLSLVVNRTFLSIVGFKPTRKKFYVSC